MSSMSEFNYKSSTVFGWEAPMNVQNSSANGTPFNHSFKSNDAWLWEGKMLPCLIVQCEWSREGQQLGVTVGVFTGLYQHTWTSKCRHLLLSQQPVYTSSSNRFQSKHFGNPLSVNHIMNAVWPNWFKKKTQARWYDQQECLYYVLFSVSCIEATLVWHFTCCFSWPWDARHE